MERHELERLRRSVVMLPEGHTAGALTKDEALKLIEAASDLEAIADRYRQAINELRQVLDSLPKE